MQTQLILQLKARAYSLQSVNAPGPLACAHNVSLTGETACGDSCRSRFSDTAALGHDRTFASLRFSRCRYLCYSKPPRYNAAHSVPTLPERESSFTQKSLSSSRCGSSSKVDVTREVGQRKSSLDDFEGSALRGGWAVSHEGGDIKSTSKLACNRRGVYL